MKPIEVIKLIFGIILLLITSIVGVIFLFESLGFSTKTINHKNISYIFSKGESKDIFIFLGFCVLAGAYLITSIKSKD
ncbi:hypothetical protein MK851_09310 [Tenacibaculum sp. 1B UA]|uniref:hypothetical protein n=1 Tax=Tenacibaculum sp. 1B UA TaxID=2922252 RepID=UPI002A2471F2|nr:hypothetical protein [Tenacibaculum sp. 1B UA]MDX8553815.1 hypothetical protein [Tenacibaculum sp. 1B UA]